MTTPPGSAGRGQEPFIDAPPRPRPKPPVYLQRRRRPPPQGASRRLRDGPVLAPAGAVEPRGGLVRSLAVVLVTRNSKAVLADRLAAWRALLPGLSVQWLLLDLGSTDGTLAAVEALRVRVVSVPGGRVRLLAAMDRTMAATDAEVVVFAEALAEPLEQADVWIDRVAHGAALGVAGLDRPGIVALAARAWRQRPLAGSPDLLGWAAGKGWVARIESPGADLDEFPGACIPTVVDRSPRRRVVSALHRLRRWLPEPSPT